MSINLTLVFQAMAFLAVVWLVMKFLWPPILGAIEERQRKIAEGLAAADRAQQELKAADERVADEIRKARVDANAITEKAHHQANAIVDKAREDAVTEAQRVKSAAEAEIANLSHKARAVLREQVAALAVAGASRILQREIDADRHRELLDQLARELQA